MAAHAAAATTTSSGMPSLPTPERTGAAFSFPYAQPYSIQLDLMTSLFEAIEQRKVAVFESPTGTGKSLSLICGTFTWLRANAKRMEQQLHERDDDEGGDGQAGDGDAGGSVEPAWVRKQDAERRRRDAMRAEDELKERIAVISRREAELKRKAKEEEDRQASSFGRKKSRTNNGQTRYDLSDEDDDGDDDDAFLPSTAAEPRPSWHSLSDATPAAAGDGDSNLSPAVRALMAQLSTSHSSSGKPIDLNDELPETTPKIIYVSRTHSQLSQFVEELRKTDFGRDVVVTDYSHSIVPEDDAVRPARVIALGSRTQMCIHEKVKKIGEKKGAEAMNEACRDLITAGAKTRCDFMPPMDNTGRSRMLDFRDRAMAKVRDIEDLVTMGKEMGTCPYYAARTSARQAELITLPYPLLLNKTARETLDISLRDSIVLVDESHNLIDTILAVHTVTVNSTQIKTATGQIEEYLNRFGGRLRGDSEVMLRTLRRLLGGLEKVCEKWAQQARNKPPSPSRGAGSQPTVEEVWTAAKVVSEMGGNLDTINFAKLERFLKDGQIARKVSSYAEREKKREDAAREKAAGMQGRGKKSGASSNGASSNGASSNGASTSSSNGTSSNGSSDSSDSTNQSAISSMHSIEAFIFSLSNSTQDGRVLLTLTPGKPSSSSSPNMPTPAVVQLKYQLLNPSEAFHPIISQARAVIMAGGTMEPTNTLRLQLVPTLPPHRWHTFSCGHIVPSSNLLCRVVPTGPRGHSFDFRHATRSDMGMLDDLGNALCNLANLVPQGMVVFLTSYKYLDDVVARWKGQGIWKRLEARKRIFTEPRKTDEVEPLLKEYEAVIKAVKTNPSSTVTGSLLLAVVGAKLSEGINFSDYLARAVIMVGMPYPNMYSPELKERQRYVREMTKTAVANGIIPPLPANVDAGNELYTNLCMKSINQSIGRAIRHQGDWAALLLLDGRYSKPDTIGRLPGWIRGETKVVKGGFGGVVRELGAFVREKKEKGVLWPVEKEEEGKGKGKGKEE